MANLSEPLPGSGLPSPPPPLMLVSLVSSFTILILLTILDIHSSTRSFWYHSKIRLSKKKNQMISCVVATSGCLQPWGVTRLLTCKELKTGSQKPYFNYHFSGKNPGKFCQNNSGMILKKHYVPNKY